MTTGNAPASGTSPRGRRTLLLIAAISVAPVVLSYVFYALVPRDARTNYGELLTTQPFPPVVGTAADGRPFRLDELRGKWAIVLAAPGACAAACERMLYATRQARTMQNAEESRVARVLLVTGEAELPPDLLAKHPGLVVARIGDDTARALPRGANAIYLVDPLGNQVLAWPPDPDVKALARDLARLLKASRIG